MRNKLCFFKCEELGRREGLLKIGRAYLNTSGQWMKNAPEGGVSADYTSSFPRWTFSEEKITSSIEQLYLAGILDKRFETKQSRKLATLANKKEPGLAIPPNHVSSNAGRLFGLFRSPLYSLYTE